MIFVHTFNLKDENEILCAYDENLVTEEVRDFLL